MKAEGAKGLGRMQIVCLAGLARQPNRSWDPNGRVRFGKSAGKVYATIMRNMLPRGLLSEAAHDKGQQFGRFTLTEAGLRVVRELQL